NLLLLCPLWVSTLKEYARVQIEPDITDAQTNVIGTGSMQNTAQTDVFDSMYSGLTREVILPYYNMSWLTILGAVASLAQKEHPYIPESKKVPTKFFFILFGLCVEALSNTFGGGSRNSSVGNNIENQKIVRTCIDALKAFLRPVVAGSAFLDEYVFIELINLFDRLVLTEGFKVQYDIIQIIGNIIKDFGVAYICKDIPKKSMKINGHGEDEAAVEFPETETILFHILRLLVNIFFQKIP
ncbi:9201_t:CDS:2, partial [Dentiscutata heterogama]